MLENIVIALFAVAAIGVAFFMGVVVGIGASLDIIEKEQQLNDDYDNGRL